MRIWFPLAILLSVGWLLLVGALASRGGDGAGSGTPLTSDVATLLRQSQAAMRGLESFQVEIAEEPGIIHRVLWQSPDSVHLLYPNDVVHYETGEESVVTHRGFVEGIVIGDTIYVRQCAGEGEDCRPWEERARERVYITGFWGEADPLWTLDLLSLVSDARIVGDGSLGGAACTRIQAEADVVQAWVHALRRAEQTQGPLDWGEECTGRATTVNGKRVEECHTLTVDEYIADIEESAAEEGTSGPVPVAIWIAKDNALVRRLEVASASFTFSRFNEVTVEPPK